MATSLYPALRERFQQFEKEFATISEERKEKLESISQYVEDQLRIGSAQLTFICTHNSRRSQLSQMWAQAAAAYYEIEGVSCYSGGTEVTAFFDAAVAALRHHGFHISMAGQSSNPRYVVSFGEETRTLLAFSKVYNDRSNPSANFAAVMTCSDADERCPMVLGATLRVALPFNDPKKFDGQPVQADKYAETSLLIGREMAYVFSLLRR